MVGYYRNSLHSPWMCFLGLFLFSFFSSSVFFPSCCLDRLQRLCLIQIFSFTCQHGIVEMSRGVVGAVRGKQLQSYLWTILNTELLQTLAAKIAALLWLRCGFKHTPGVMLGRRETRRRSRRACVIPKKSQIEHIWQTQDVYSYFDEVLL